MWTWTRSLKETLEIASFLFSEALYTINRIFENGNFRS